MSEYVNMIYVYNDIINNYKLYEKEAQYIYKRYLLLPTLYHERCFDKSIHLYKHETRIVV